mgnify:CR=1 FL=1
MRRVAADAPGDGKPCCAWIGTDGAGHFVKMVHNGIEYADMQVIGEAYHLLRYAAGLEPAQIADIFAEWNKGDLDSYLIEITAEVLRQVDAGTLALEIEWNNKDPFFDRDLENFHRLHAQSVISVGIIVTRGRSLQAALPGIVRTYLAANRIEDPAALVELDALVRDYLQADPGTPPAEALPAPRPSTAVPLP